MYLSSGTHNNVILKVCGNVVRLVTQFIDLSPLHKLLFYTFRESNLILSSVVVFILRNAVFIITILVITEIRTCELSVQALGLECQSSMLTTRPLGGVLHHFNFHILFSFFDKAPESRLVVKQYRKLLKYKVGQNITWLFKLKKNIYIDNYN